MSARIYVLIVEDDAPLREAIVNWLESLGVDVVAVDDGAQALAHLDSGGHPHLIVTDVVMPGVLGNSVASYVESKHELKDIPVVLMTGTPKLAAKGHRLLVKPFHITELVSVLESAGIPVAA